MSIPSTRGDPWKNTFVFLLLASATLVTVLLLRATFLVYGTLYPQGRFLAWFVGIGAVLALASLGLMILRLYVSPILPPRRRKRNA